MFFHEGAISAVSIEHKRLKRGCKWGAGCSSSVGKDWDFSSIPCTNSPRSTIPAISNLPNAGHRHFPSFPRSAASTQAACFFSNGPRTAQGTIRKKKTTSTWTFCLYVFFFACYILIILYETGLLKAIIEKLSFGRCATDALHQRNYKVVSVHSIIIQSVPSTMEM